MPYPSPILRSIPDRTAPRDVVLWAAGGAPAGAVPKHAAAPVQPQPEARGAVLRLAAGHSGGLRWCAGGAARADVVMALMPLVVGLLAAFVVYGRWSYFRSFYRRRS